MYTFIKKPLNSLILTTLTKSMPEAELVASLKSNSQQAFEYLYDQYSSGLYGIIYKILKDDAAAEDTMQEVFLKIWKKISDYDPSKGRLYTWMLNIARNAAIDQFRKTKNVHHVDVQDLSYADLNNEKVQSNTELSEMKIFTDKLNPDRQALIDMVYFQGYTQEEASEILNIPLGTAKSRIRTALQELKSLLKYEY